MILALFDFDGTITTKDSLVDFIQYAVGKTAYYKGLFCLSPMLAGYTLKLIPNYIAKEKLLSYFFKGWDAKKFSQLAKKYSLEEIDKTIRPQATEKIAWHKEQGHTVVIVSASMENWLKAWCVQARLELISTKLEVKDNKLTGKFSTKNCYGTEKAIRVKAEYDLSKFDYIYAYGDSRGDRELLALADKSFYKPFRGNQLY